jgi:hypothetical protein
VEGSNPGAVEAFRVEDSLDSHIQAFEDKASSHGPHEVEEARRMQTLGDDHH